MTTGTAKSSTAASDTGGTTNGIVTHHLRFTGAGDGSLSDSAWEAVVSHSGRHPHRALLLLAPGLDISPGTISLSEQLARETSAGTAFTALTNAVADLNPFSGLRAEHSDQIDFPALVSLLGPGEVHEIHRLPPHFLLLPAATIEFLARRAPRQADQAPSFHDLLDDIGGKLLAHDRLFVHDSTTALGAAAALASHEDSRPPSWGYLAQRLADWLENTKSPEQLAQAIEKFGDTALEQSDVCLHITHSWGGGVARWVDSFIEADNSGLHFQLRSEGPKSGDGAGQRLALYAGTQTAQPVACWWLEPVIASTVVNHPQYSEILSYIADRYGVTEVIVSSLVGHSLDALRLDRPTVEVLHDFYPAWPLLGIHPQPFLDDDGAQLGRAMQQHSLLPDFRGRGPAGWRALGRQWLEAIRTGNITLVAPSRSVAELLPRLEPEFSALEPKVIAHGLADDWAVRDWQPRPRRDGRLRLLVPGRLPRGKGKALLAQALAELRPLARVCLLGAGKDGEDFFGIEDVDVVMSFRREDLPAQIASMAPDVAALLSTVPETFGYMLSEMHQLGVPVIATRVGSFAERITEGVDGWLIDPDPASLVEKVSWLARNRDRIAEMHRELLNRPRRTASDMVGDYRALTADRAVPRAPSAIVEFPSRSQAGPLASIAAQTAGRLEILEQKLGKAQEEIEERTRWARERDRILRQEKEEAARWVKQVERTLEREADAHKHTRSQLDDMSARYEAVLGSTSWTITRPLRVAKRLGRNFMRARAWNPLRWPLLLSQLVRTISTLGWHDTMLRLQNTQVVHAPRVVQSDLIEPVGDPEPPALMPRSEHPLVSIVIPVHNQWAHTAACLRSIASADCRAGFEVIVIDDASSDETADRLSGVNGIDATTNRNNLGFIGSCNRGAARVNGDFIVFLNNDTQVMDGWLDHLLHTFAQFPDTGIAGARLIYPDGSLQECGGIVFNDGSGWNYGRGDDPDRPEYQYVREVDYCSGACIMMRHQVFSELGGFDRHFSPAYYEDTDLAFRVRDLGLKVRVQPAATVVHHEGVTSGTDIASGTKRFQAVNRKKFVKRWQEQLAGQPAPIVNNQDHREIRTACDHRLRGRVLIIDAYTPEPDQDSGSLRLRYLVECLFELGFGVSFIPDNRSHAGRYTEELQQAGVEAWYEPWLDSMNAWFSQHGADFDFVIVCRHYVATNYLSLVRRRCPRAKLLFDTIDLHYLREERQADLEDSLPLRRSAGQTKRSELAVIREADATLVVSPTEIEVLRQELPDARVHLLSNIHRVVGSQNTFEARKDIFFVGGFQHPPNVDAALWFCSAVWPLIRARLPDLNFHLIGSKAPDQIKALAGNGVVFQGFVPRLEPFLDGCRLAIAPLRYGAGVKGKVNLSMSRGQPVVATPAAVEGLFARDGEDVLVASEPQAFADAVVRLYNDPELWTRLSANGLRNVEEYFSLDTARRNLKAILESFN